MSELRVVVPPVPSVVGEVTVVVESVDPLVLDSIFPAPGRNDPCHCGSGDKYKRCHQDSDREAWRIVALKTRQADAARSMLRAMPSLRSAYGPELA